MPIEIRELVIRAVVEDSPTTSTSGAALPEGDIDREALIRACVERVLRILRRSGER
jgi:hypothetical protein